MDYSINLIDHTINSILAEKQETFLDYDLFEILKKYSVTTIDLSVNSVMRILNPVKAHIIRMEVDFGQIPIEQLDKYYNLNFDGIILRWSHGKDLTYLRKFLEAVNTKTKPVYLKAVNSLPLERTDFLQYEALVEQYTIAGFILCDVESRLDPYTVIDYINLAKEIISCKIEFCAGNGCGLATANSLATIHCGINNIHTVVGGASLTEGAAMEEIILSCKYFQVARVCERTSDLAKDCRRILQCMQLRIPIDKAIIGNGIFSHESGIHVDGIIKNPRLYEVISPEEVGVKRRIIIGKHSGKAAIKMRYEEMGIKLTEEEISGLTKKIKQVSLSQNSSLSYRQLIDLYIANTNHNKLGGGPV